MTNQTHGGCLAPPSLFIQAVRLRLFSADIDNLVQTNYDHYFDYIADFQMTSVYPEFMITETLITITGKNFNSSHSYSVVMNSTESVSYKFPT